MNNIALIGKAGSGKTTLAKTLDETHVHLSFARPVKEISVGVYNLIAKHIGAPSRLTLDDLHGRDKYMFRTLMQVVGTELGRDMFGHNVWVDQIRKAVQTHTELETPMVIDDVRFLNELRMLIEWDFKPVYILRGESNDTHSSEKLTVDDVLEFCSEHGVELTIIENDGTLEELKEKFQQVIR